MLALYGPESRGGQDAASLSNYNSLPGEFAASTIPHLSTTRRTAGIAEQDAGDENSLTTQGIGATTTGVPCSLNIALQFDPASPMGAAPVTATDLRDALGSADVDVFSISVDTEYGRGGFEPRIGVTYDDRSGQFVKTGREWPDRAAATPDDLRAVEGAVERSRACVEAAHGRTLAGAGPQVLGAPRGALSRGLGTTRPATIHLGGASSSGIITDLTWTSWGDRRAEGTGTAAYLPPGGANAEAVRTRATVVASDLGVCDGRVAYRRLTTYFPQYGETPNRGVDVCGT
jgi:hypothetical protein